MQESDMTLGVVVPERMPWPVRLLGGRWKDGRRSYRMRWGDLNIGRRGAAVDLCLFEEGHSLHLRALWIDTFIKLPFLRRWRREPHEIMESWGFSLDPEMGLHLHWGRHTKVLTMPWRNWVQSAHDVLRADGSWAPYAATWRDEEPDGRHIEKHPYRYVLRSGEVQNREASIYVERRTRKLKALRWLPFGRTSHSIDVAFSEEVGERTGSWKGGCVGCGYTLRPGETPREALYRMQEERKF
jgi:hypothetical protein